MTATIKWILGNRTASVVLAALLIFGCITAYQTFQTSGESKVYLAELKAAKAHAKLIDARAENAKAAAEADIAAQDIIIVNLRDSIGRKDIYIGALTQHTAGLESALANAKTDGERVPILTALVSDWTQKFTLADAKCKEYQGIIFSLEKNLTSKDAIILAWSGQYDAAQSTIAASDKALSSIRADLRRAKFWGTVKSGAVIGLIGYTLYNLITK